MAAVYTELFRVSPEAVETLLDPELEIDPATSIWLRGLGDLELVALWESLPSAQSVGTLMSEPLTDVESECVLLKVPEDFLQAILKLTDEQIPEIVVNWQQTDELADWSLEDLTRYFRDIRKLAGDAAAQDELVVQRMVI